MLLSKIWVKKQEEGTWEGLMQLNTGLELSSTCGLDEKIWALQSPVAVGVRDSLKSPEGVCWGGGGGITVKSSATTAAWRGRKGGGTEKRAKLQRIKMSLADSRGRGCGGWHQMPKSRWQVLRLETRPPAANLWSPLTFGVRGVSDPTRQSLESSGLGRKMARNN